MAELTGKELAEGIRQKVDELKKVCRGVDESTASRAPEGRWSPKEILSHLWGPDGNGPLPLFQQFLSGETPTLDLDPGNPFFSESRSRMTFSALLAEVEKSYERITAFAAGLTREQLARKARIPKMKESPWGEYPTLENMISVLGEHHLQSHSNHMREILQALGVQTEGGK
ncbi:MAG TPA: DinB family protein [Syntrophales bacterium]|nr:DinB family protein [Syntrophales bacterium]